MGTLAVPENVLIAGLKSISTLSFGASPSAVASNENGCAPGEMSNLTFSFTTSSAGEYVTRLVELGYTAEMLADTFATFRLAGPGRFVMLLAYESC